MTKLEKLIAKLCPGGVEFVGLEDICHISRGRVMSKDYLRDNAGEFPVYSSQTANNGIFGYISSYDYDCESITWTTDGANAGSVFYHKGEKFSITNVCGLLRVIDVTLASTKFIFYFLQVTAKGYVNDGMGNPKLMSNVMATIKIPLPPLSVQREIVQILDNFTELTAELTARKKQYEHYRNSLLSFDAGGNSSGMKCPEVKWMTLGEICDIVRGNGLQKKDFTAMGVGCIHYGQIYTYYGTFADRTKSFVSPELARTLRTVNKGDLIITNTSENVEDVCKAVAWLGDENIVTGGHATILKHKQNPKYLAYYTQTDMFHTEKRKYAGGTKVIDVSATNMAKLLIPVPPLDEQERIVSILDRFDALTTDITSGLPAEIEARRKQYEYYRDKLLTFKEAA